mgnify:CR=1 FL=1
MNRNNLLKLIRDFMKQNPTQLQIELFYINKIILIDKRSITEIILDI